jgi:CheY-like chemotaxis protein
MTQTDALSGRRVLVVEDEALVAALLSDMLEDAGATVIGPAGTLGDAAALARDADVDAAILDVNLHGQRVDPVAATLAERGVPFAFATGYGRAPAGPFETAPVLGKPYEFDEVSRVLAQLLAGAGAAGAET